MVHSDKYCNDPNRISHDHGNSPSGNYASRDSCQGACAANADCKYYLWRHDPSALKKYTCALFSSCPSVHDFGDGDGGHIWRNPYVQYRVVSQEFGVLSGIDYSLATAIAKRATLTPFSGSSMICRLEPDTATAESVFFTAAPMRARVFKHTQNAAISGHNVRHLSSKTVDDCKSECRKSAWCKSFDYNKQQQACSLSDVNAVAVGGLKTDYVGNPYDYYEMRTLVTAEAVDANNLLERCEQRAAGCWAKVRSGCKGAPASGFGNRWKKIFDFEGKARACGLMAAKIDAQCAVSPGTTEMRYVAAH